MISYDIKTYSVEEVGRGWRAFAARHGAIAPDVPVSESNAVFSEGGCLHLWQMVATASSGGLVRITVTTRITLLHEAQITGTATRCASLGVSGIH